MSVKNYLTEFVGTFFLVLTIGLTTVSGTPMAPLAIGSVIYEFRRDNVTLFQNGVTRPGFGLA